MLIDVIIQIEIVLIVIVYTVANLIVSAKYDVSEMKEEFVTSRRLFGKIFANIFYALAWLLKGLKFLLNKFVA